MTTIYAITSLIAVAVLIIAITAYDWKKILGSPILTLTVSAIVARLIAMKIHPGFETDINCFKSWANMLFNNGLANFYTTADTFTDYPPGYMYCLYIIGMIRRVLGLDWDGYAFGLLIRLPAIVCDVLTGLFIYKLSLKKLHPRLSWLLALSYMLNPAIIIDSSVWGQVDSVYSLFIFASVYFIAEDMSASTRKEQGSAGLRGDYTLFGFLLFAAAVLIKPQAFIFSPVYLFITYNTLSRANFNKSTRLRVLRWIVFSAALLFAGMLPFAPGLNFKPIINQYIETLRSYPYATVNAYNFYGFLGANWRPVGEKFLFLTYNAWGTIFIELIVILSIYLLNRNRTKANVFFVAGLINTLTFIFSARMHERYLYPSIILFLLAFIYKKDKKLLMMYVGYSLTFFINCADILNLYANEADYGLIKTSMPFVSFINMILTGFTLYTAFTCFKKSKSVDETEESGGKPKLRLLVKEKSFRMESPRHLAGITIRDLLPMGVLMLVYGAISFTNLGNTQSPQTVWTADTEASVVVRFSQSEEIKTLHFMLGAKHDKSFVVSTSTDGVYYENATEIKGESVFAWKDVEMYATARYVRIVSLDNELMIQEMGFRNTSGELIEIADVSDGGESLFDEHSLVPEKSSFMNSTYFDEIYHARTAYEFVNHLSVYEWTHPPLGKVIISLGIYLFGMTPFGWRFMGTLFGVLMIPLIYCFGKKMFGNWKWAFFAAFIFTFDFMHFAQTRISTIDTYVTFFIIGMYYFMYIYCHMSFYKDKLLTTLIPLGLSGLCMGLAIACKWPGIYAAAGLAVLFFRSFYLRTREYLDDKKMSDGQSTRMYPRYAAVTICLCFLFFVAVPVLVYCLSYIPYLQTPGTDGFKSIIDNQSAMFNYHAHLESEHPYSSPWWSWPFNWRPIFYYLGTAVQEGVRSGISSFGNPAVWWCGVAAVFYCVAAQSRKRDTTTLFLMVALAAQYLPWMLVSRTTYIYHYFPSVPFVVLMITYMFKNAGVRARQDKNSALEHSGGAGRAPQDAALLAHAAGAGRAPQDAALLAHAAGEAGRRVDIRRLYPVGYAVVVLALFILFYPILSGTPISVSFVQTFLQWLPTWQLI